MEKSLATLDKGTTCSSWNYSGQRLATGSLHGTLTIFDSRDPSSSSFSCTSKSKVHDSAGIVKVVWVPPAYGHAVACVCADGTLSLWEEIVEDAQPLQWKLCKSFKSDAVQLLDIQFGGSSSSLKMVTAYSDGNVKVFELLDPLELKNWQLQAEIQNVIDSVSTLGKAVCLSASISWNPQGGESRESSFVLGFNSDTPQLNSSKVWEFDQAHQRWLPVAELASPDDKGDRVYAVAWAPNIGRWERFCHNLLGTCFFANALKLMQEYLGSVPLLHVDDACQAHIFCMEQPSMRGRFGCAVATNSIKEIAMYFQEIYPEYKIAKESTEGPEQGSKSDFSKLMKMGFEYKYSMKDILDDSVAWAKKLNGGSLSQVV